MQKFKSLIVLLLLFTLVYFGYQGFVVKQSINRPVLAIDSSAEKSKDKEPLSQNSSEDDSINNKTINETQHKKEKPYAFSPDPLVNASVINMKFYVCQVYFLIKENLNMSLETMYQSKKQLEYFNNASKNCENLNQLHPEYRLNSTIDGMIEYSKITSNSRLGKLLQRQDIPIGESLPEKDVLYIYETIANEFPDLIGSPIPNIINYEIKIIYPDLKYLLQTTNTQYVSRITNLTKALMACELGVNCSANGTLMNYYCRSEVNFCVPDFNTLFKTQLSVGVQADVLLALPYYKELYKVAYTNKLD